MAEFIHSYNIDSNVYQQSYHAVPADWEELQGFLLNTLKATHVILSPVGVIRLTLGGKEYSARMSAIVSPHDGSELAEETELHGLGDTNNDGLPDFKVRYKNGQSQTLYILP